MYRRLGAVARQGSLGGIWFTQSTRNRPEEGKDALWQSIDVVVAAGTVGEATVAVFDPASGTTTPVFRATGADSEPLIDEIDARIAAGRPWLELMEPALWEPAPGLVTGMILSPGDGPVSVTGLGNALVRLER